MNTIEFTTGELLWLDEFSDKAKQVHYVGSFMGDLIEVGDVDDSDDTMVVDKKRTTKVH